MFIQNSLLFFFLLFSLIIIIKRYGYNCLLFISRNNFCLCFE